MPSTYSSSLRLELQATGENSNTWGTKTNNNLNLIEQAVAGYVKITLVSASATYNLTIDNASASDGRNAFIEFAGTVASAISVVVPDVEKGYWVKNSATGSNLTFRTSGGTGFTLPQNDWIFVISDGVSAYPVTTSLTNYARINQANTFTNTNNFTSAVTITGPVSITGATVITSATDIRANLSVTGTTNLVGNVVVSGATTLASAVDIKGATSLASTLVVGGATDIRANLSVTGSTNLVGNVIVSGSTLLASVVDVKGATSLASTLVVGGNTDIRANLSVTGTTNIVGNVVVSGSTILTSTVDIKGATSLASTLVVGGNTIINGSVSVSGSFAVSGASTFTSVVNIRANASVVGNFLVSGAVTLASTVDIKGATSLASTFKVNGNSTFSSNVSVSGSVVINGKTIVIGESFPADNIRTSITMSLKGGYINCYDPNLGNSGNLTIESTNLQLNCVVSSTGGIWITSNPVYVSSAGIILGNGTTGGGSNVLAINNGTAPSLSIADGVLLFAQDVAASSELRVRDEAGNVTTLSPHNFILCGGPSEDMAWSYYSEKNGRAVNIDMMRLARIVEKLTGEKLIYIEDLP